MRVGVIADTHGVLHPGVPEAFTGVGLILHAGDVGSEGVLDLLGRLAPVEAIRGNADPEPLARRLPSERLVEAGGRRLLLVHAFPDGRGGLVTDPRRAAAAFHRHVADLRADVVCFGHSHRAGVERVGRVLFVNPGGGGRKRFTLPRSVALLDLSGPEPEADIVYLAPA